MGKSNTAKFAERELDILVKSSPDPNNRPIIEEFIPEILALVDKFGHSGQSGGSAPFVASALSSAIKSLCLQKPICDITGIDEEWVDVSSYGGSPDYQNIRCSALFKNGSNGKPYYLDAIIWKGDRSHDTFSGTVQGIRSRQSIKSFPWKPKTFYIDVIRVPYDSKKHSRKESVTCGDGDYVYFIKDINQIQEVFEYYDRPLESCPIFTQLDRNTTIQEILNDTIK